LRVLILVLLFTFVFAGNVSLPVLFKKGFYTQICNNRWLYINKYVDKREDLLSIVAYSCLKKGYLVPALDLAKVLKITPMGRKNATYITTLFLMKKLIIEYVFDDFDLRKVKLPKIKDNLLGVVFNYLATNKINKKTKNGIIISENNKKITININKNYNLIIEMYIDNKLIKKVKYW